MRSSLDSHGPSVPAVPTPVYDGPGMEALWKPQISRNGPQPTRRKSAKRYSSASFGLRSAATHPRVHLSRRRSPVRVRLGVLTHERAALRPLWHFGPCSMRPLWTVFHAASWVRARTWVPPLGTKPAVIGVSGAFRRRATFGLRRMRPPGAVERFVGCTLSAQRRDVRSCDAGCS